MIAASLTANGGGMSLFFPDSIMVLSLEFIALRWVVLAKNLRLGPA